MRISILKKTFRIEIKSRFSAFEKKAILDFIMQTQNVAENHWSG